MRWQSSFAFLLLTALPAAAQQAAAPKGWHVRPDRPGSDTAGVFAPMAPGWHITTGRTSAIFWDPAMQADHVFRVEMEVFFFRDQSRDTEGYGLVLGGKNLDGPSQDYVYVLLRNDGKYSVKHRAGEAVHTITDWTAHPAIAVHGPQTSGATVKNVLLVEAGADSVRYSINGQRAFAFSRSAPDVNGLVGLRVNHGLNLHVSKLAVQEGR